MQRNIPHIPQIQFQKISNPFATDILQDKALGDLSADQGLLLEYCIRTEVKNVVEKCGVRKWDHQSLKMAHSSHSTALPLHERSIAFP